MKGYLVGAGLLLMLCLAGCSGNYKYTDDDYRALGEPTAHKQGA